MRKILFASVLALLPLGVFAQEQTYIEHEYSAFTAITMTDDIQATIIPSEKYSVKIYCDERIENYIIAYVKEGVLDISIDTKSMPSDVKKLFKAGTGSGKVKDGQTPITAPELEISLPTLKSLSVKGSSTVTSTSTLKSDKMTLIFGKTASVSDFTVDADELYIEMSNKANAELKVDVGLLNIKAGNNSVLQARIDAEEVEIEASALSYVELLGDTDSISIECQGGADVIVRPKSLQTE